MKSNMQCEKLENRIHGLLDKGCGPEDDAAVVEHVASCNECAQVVAAYQAMLDGVDALPAPEPSEGFLDGIVWPAYNAKPVRNDRATRRWAASPTGRRSSRHRPSAGWIAAVATLAVAASFLVMAALQPPPETDEVIATFEDAVDPDALFAGIQLPPERVHAACETTGRRLVSLPGAVRRATLELDTTRYTAPIRPVVQPMGAAWEAVKRTLPSGGTSTPDSGADTGWIRDTLHVYA